MKFSVIKRVYVCVSLIHKSRQIKYFVFQFMQISTFIWQIIDFDE